MAPYHEKAEAGLEAFLNEREDVEVLLVHARPLLPVRSGHNYVHPHEAVYVDVMCAWSVDWVGFRHLPIRPTHEARLVRSSPQDGGGTARPGTAPCEANDDRNNLPEPVQHVQELGEGLLYDERGLEDGVL